jgi:hypothetical protein
MCAGNNITATFVVISSSTCLLLQQYYYSKAPPPITTSAANVSSVVITIAEDITGEEVLNTLLQRDKDILTKLYEVKYEE